MNKILECEIDNEAIEFMTFYYENLEDVSKLVRETGGYDVLLFTGPIPYYLSLKEATAKGLPSTYISLDEFVVVLSLYYVNNQLNQDSNRISYDIEQSNYVTSVYKELNLPTDSIYVIEYRPLLKKCIETFDVDEIVQYHYKLWKENKVDLVMTTISTVYDRLTELGVNCFRMLLPKKKIIDKLNDAYNQGELMRMRKSQIAVGLVSIDDYKEIAKDRDKNDVKSIVLELHQMLLSFGRDIDATVNYVGEDQFIIYGTKGALKYITNQYKNLPILNKVTEYLKVNVSIGFGVGYTANEAEENAQTAIHHSREISDRSTCFIVTDEKLVIGPLNENTKDFYLRSDDDAILTIVKDTGISVKNVSKFIKFIEIRGSKNFTSIELSEHLQLTRRSSDRILKKLLEGNVVEVIGEEQPYSKGRPRALYEYCLGKTT